MQIGLCPFFPFLSYNPLDWFWFLFITFTLPSPLTLLHHIPTSSVIRRSTHPCRREESGCVGGRRRGGPYDGRPRDILRTRVGLRGFYLGSSSSSV